MSEDRTPSLVVESQDHLDWIVRADMRNDVLGSAAPDWLALESCPDASLTETGHQRAVWRVCCKEFEIFAKVSRVSGLRARVKSVGLGTPAEREWRVAVEAAVRHVALPEFIALGVGKGAETENVLLTVAIPNATTLTTLWQESTTRRADPSGRRGGAELIQEVASLLYQAHQAGFSHRDGHPNNILVSQPDDGSGMRAFYVDALGARLTRGPVGMAKVVHSFAQLDQHFHRVATRTDRLRLLRAYLSCEQAGHDGAGARPWRRRLVLLIGQQRKKIAASLARLRDRRLSKDNKYFARMRLANRWQATVALHIERRHVFPEPHVPNRTREDWRKILDAALTSMRGTSNHTTSVASGDVDLECSKMSGFIRSLAATWRRSAHRCSFEHCHQLRHRDVFAELILGYAEHRSFGLVDASVLIRPRVPSLATRTAVARPRHQAEVPDLQEDDSCPHESR